VNPDFASLNIAQAVLLVAYEWYRHVAGEGVGMGTAARAMANFGLWRLRLVDPRDGWPNERARKAASGADFIIDRVEVFETLEEAIADLHFVYATTARPRGMTKRVVTPEEAGRDMHARVGKGQAGDRAQLAQHAGEGGAFRTGGAHAARHHPGAFRFAQPPTDGAGRNLTRRARGRSCSRWASESWCSIPALAG